MQMVAGDILSLIGRISWVYFLFEWRGETRRIWKLSAGGGLLCACYALLCRTAGGGAAGLHSGFFLLGIALIWSMARYRDMRFWFAVFAVHALGFCAEALAGAGAAFLGSPSAVSVALAVCLYSAGDVLFFRCGARFREALKTDGIQWRMLALLSFCYYLTALTAAGGRRAVQAGRETPLLMAVLSVTALVLCVLVGRMFWWAGRFHRASEELQGMEKKLSFQKNYYCLAYSDSLTGLWNRRAFDEELNRIVGKRQPFFYASFDVNGLKQINDERGHLDGDTLLKRAAEFLRENEGGIFTSYRVGGDEFAYLACPGADVPGGDGCEESRGQGSEEPKGRGQECQMSREERALESLRAEQERLAQEQRGFPYFAIGSGRLTRYESEEEVLDFLNQVDRRMYEDKMRIKNRRPGSLSAAKDAGAAGPGGKR